MLKQVLSDTLNGYGELVTTLIMQTLKQREDISFHSPLHIVDKTTSLKWIHISVTLDA